MSEQFLRDVESNINKLHEKNADLKAENQRLREALEVMLHIFDRDLPEKSIGRKYCDEAKAALEDK